MHQFQKIPQTLSSLVRRRENDEIISHSHKVSRFMSSEQRAQCSARRLKKYKIISDWETERGEYNEFNYYIKILIQHREGAKKKWAAAKTEGKKELFKWSEESIVECEEEGELRSIPQALSIVLEFHSDTLPLAESARSDVSHKSIMNNLILST